MPNDNIKRTIEKALGAGNSDNYESVTYEGYGPGGVAVIVEALTDNRQRTAPERAPHTSTSTAGTWAPPAACPGPSTRRAFWSSTTTTELDEDTVMMDALDSRCRRLRGGGRGFHCLHRSGRLRLLCWRALEEKGYTFLSAQCGDGSPELLSPSTNEEDIKNMEKLHRPAGG